MKTTIIFSSACALLLGLSACNQNEGRFLNLTSGEEVELVRDDEGRMVNKETQKPVLLYVDTKSRDTFYGLTGEKVNGRLQMMDKGVYVYNDGERKIKIDGEEYKVKDGNSKEKWEGEEYKYKNDEVKIKGEGDEFKYKADGLKKKVDEDGDVKVKTDDKKIKIDSETGERKVKERSVFSKVKDKVTGN
jgi:hypothetical protein